VFDRIFNNIRSATQRCEINSVLENVHPKIPITSNKLKFFYLFPVSYLQTEGEKTDEISFSQFVELSKLKGKVTFSISEMYFNIHRVMGGIYVFFWGATFFFVLSYVPKIFECLSCIPELNVSPGMLFCFIAVNITLALFTASQSCKYRMFANYLIYYATTPSDRTR